MYAMYAETNVSIVAIGFFLLVGLAFVGVLILGAVLAAKRETRTAGLWILGGTLGLAVILPLAWLLLSYGGDHTTVVRDEYGRQIQVQRGGLAPIWSFILIAVGLGLLVGEIAMLIHPRTRTAGLILLGVGVLAALFVMPIRTSYNRPQPPAQVGFDSGANRVDEIPLDETADQAGRVTLPAASDAPAASEPTVENEATAESAPPPAEPSPSAPPTAPTTATADTAAAESDASSTSVSYINGVTITSGSAKSLPDWAKEGGGLKSDGTYFVVVESGPHRSFHDCWELLTPLVEDKVREYGVRTGGGFRNRWPSMRLPEHLYDQLIAEHFIEKRDTFSFGEPMLTLYSRVEFSTEAVAAIDAWQADLLARNRTIFAGVLGALVVALVGVLYGYFRIDTATLGYYTWRLRVAAGVLMAVVVVAGFISGAIFFDEEWRLGGIAF